MLHLASIIDSPLPLEVEGLLPYAMAGESLAEIERFEVLHGNRRLPLAEFFEVSGDPSDGVLRLSGNLTPVHRLGVGMDGGKILVEGSIGRHVGAQMRSGEIIVQGNASDFAGCEMRGGLLHIAGDAGNYLGSAYAGSKRGVRGGTILVSGNAGQEIAHCMRRGLIAVAGSAGEFAAMDMLAGTLMVFGPCGPRPGANMRRGTVALFGESPRLLPTFRLAGRAPSTILRMLLIHLRALRFPFDGRLLEANYDLFHGDAVSLGRGEVFIARR